MAGRRKIDDYRKVLAVEGYSDLLFYAEALEHVGKHNEVFIQHFNGAHDLLVKLETLLSPGLLADKESIGVIFDADADPEARKQSVANVLFSTTDRKIEHGVWSPGPPRLGFVIVPDGSSRGEVETLVWQAWSGNPGNAPAVECITNYLSCMGQCGYRPGMPPFSVPWVMRVRVG